MEEEIKKIELDKGISLLFIWGIGFGVAVVFYNVYVVAHFLNIFDLKTLVQAFIVSGFVGLTLSSVFIYFQKHFNFARLATIFSFILTIFLFSLFWGIQIAEDSLQAGFIFWAGCSMMPLNTLVQTIFWGVFGRIFGTQEGRKYSSRANFGFILSGIITYLGIWIMIPLFPDFNFNLFILFSAICFAFSLFFLNKITSKFKTLKITAADTPKINYENSLGRLFISKEKKEKNQENDYKKNRDEQAQKRQYYFLYLISFVLLSTIAIIFVDILFYKVIDIQYSKSGNFEEGDFMMFLSALGLFYLMLSSIFKVSLKAGKRSLYQFLVDKYGIRMGLLILPMILSVFLLAIIIFDTLSDLGFSDPLILLLITIPKLLSDVLREVLQTPVFRLYFTPIPISLRFDIQLKLEGVIREVSIIIAGLLMLYFINTGYFEKGMHIQIWLSIFTIIIWCYTIFLIYRQYRKQLENTLEQEQKRNQNSANTRNQSQARSIIQQLPTISFQKLPVYLNMLKTLNPVIYKEGILLLVDDDNSNIQKIVLLQAVENCVLESIPILKEITKSKYFPVMENNELVTKTYNFLRGAEFRLERIKYIQQLTLSKLVNERVFGALLTTYSGEDFKIEILSQLLQDVEYTVRYYAIVASAKSINQELQNMLIDKLQDSRYSTAASAAILATGESLLPALDSAFYTTGQSELVQLRIIQTYGLLNTSNSIQLLLSKLNYSNQNISAKALETLSRCDYTVPEDNQNSIFSAVRIICENLVWNMSASVDIERHQCGQILHNAMEVEIDRNFDKLFNLLSLVYDSESITNVKTNLFSDNDDQATFALELLDMFLEKTLKPVVLPLLTKASYQEKIQSLDNQFDIKPFEKEELLLGIIRRDYNWLNRWTKAVALNVLFENGYQDTTIFVANMVNPDEILREISCKALYNLDYERLQENLKRIEFDSNYEAIKETSQNVINIESDKTNSLPILKYDIVEVLDKVEEFADVSGETLSHIAKLTKIEKYSSEETLQTMNSIDELDYFIVYQGFVMLYKNEEQLREYGEGEWLNHFEFINIEAQNFTLKASIDAIVYRIPRYKFDELLSFYPELPTSILKNTTIDRVGEVKNEQKLEEQELINV